MREGPGEGGAQRAARQQQGEMNGGNDRDSKRNFEWLVDISDCISTAAHGSNN